MAQGSCTWKSWFPVISFSVALVLVMGLFPSAASSQATPDPVDVATGYAAGPIDSAESLPAAVVAPAAPAATAAAPLGQYGFESGTAEGWFPRGSAVLTVTTEAAHSGSYSLKVTGRTASWNSPGLNVLGRIQPNGTYEIGGCMRLVAGQTVTQTRGIISMERTLLDDSKRWDWVAPSAPNGVTAGDWTCMQATYSFDTPVKELVLYVETQGDTADFYVDDVFIRLVAPPPSGTVVEYNFEDTTTQGWGPRGSVTLAASTEAAHTGNYSLKTTGRTATWNGPSLDVRGMVLPGNTYTIRGCVRLVPGQAITQTQIVFTMHRKPTGEDDKYEWIVSSGPNGVNDSEWRCLQGTYTYAGTVDALTLYVEAPNSANAAYYLDDVVISLPSLPPIQTDIPSVYQTYYTGTYPIIIGAAIEPEQLDSVRHTLLLTYHFNSLTPENVMKPGPIHPAEDTYNWTGADRLADFARANNMFIHGHTLVWHEQTPDWMFLAPDGTTPLTPTAENKALVLQRLTDHIITVTQRYSDVVNVWDVVNEVIDPAQPDCMRRSRWYELTGMDYISTAFHVAHQMVPSATLLLNDYGETDPQKRQCMYNVVRDLREAGVPVEGIGMQFHINIESPTPAEVERTIQMFASLGVELHVTEFDMSIYTSATEAYQSAAEVPEDLLIRQGHRYKEIFNVFKRYAEHIKSITFWGMADDHTWLTNRPIPRVDMPLLFDQQQQAKYAYWGVVDPSQLPPLRQRLNAARATPTIDGDAEVLWNMLPWALVGTNGTITATFQTRWDEDMLYLFVDVDDPTQDVTDAVDVFIDEGNDKAGAYGEDDWHYKFQKGTVIPPYGTVIPPDPGVVFSMSVKPGGYRLEAGFPFSGTVKEGDQVGFDIRVTDGSQPDAPVSWNDLSHSQELSTTTWGTLVLIGPYKLTHAIYGTPVIDAQKDPLWTAAEEITTDVWVMGTSGSTARVRTLWDEGHLYVYAVVSDTLLTKKSSNPWEQDSIEVFIDQNNAKTTSYEDDDGQFRVNYMNEQTYRGVFASADTITSATRIIPGGYVVELAITFNAISPTVGGMIGFDFQVNNDEDGDGVRDSVAIWNDPTGESWRNTSRIGVLQFAERVERVHQVYLPLVMRNFRTQ